MQPKLKLPAHENRRRGLVNFSLVVALAAVVLLAVGTGPVRIPPAQIVGALAKELTGAENLALAGNLPENAGTILFQIRMPRVVLSALVGACLAVSGAVLQGLLRNPLAEPYVLGISSGAALGATLAILFGVGAKAFGFQAVPGAAFLLGMGTTFLVYNLARVGGRVTMTTLLLAGIAVGSLLSALTSLAMVLSGQELHKVIFWLMGGFAGATWSDVKTAFPYMVAGTVPIFFLARELNLLLLGDETARHLGSQVERVRLVLLAAASLVTAAAVSVSGIIGFVGLIIPHGVRMLVGPDHRVLLPAGALVGAIFLVLADTLARTVAGALEIPVGVITALAGAPFFLYLLRREKSTGF